MLCLPDISIHKALAGLDFPKAIQIYNHYNFNPQGPRGPRLYERDFSDALKTISIHKALAGLDM